MVARIQLEYNFGIRRYKGKISVKNLCFSEISRIISEAALSTKFVMLTVILKRSKYSLNLW
jgi:hypothetical protein